MDKHTITPAQLAGCIDHTLLKADADAKDIEKLCGEAREYGFTASASMARVWIGPSFSGGHRVKVVCVAGFPLARVRRRQAL